MKYLVEMADMGYGLTRKTIMELALTIIQKSEQKNPFSGGKAGRAWFEGFRRRHPQISLRASQPSLRAPQPSLRAPQPSLTAEPFLTTKQ